MVDETKLRETTGGAGARETPGSAYLADPLQGIRATRRWTWIGVLTALFSSLPARHFLVGSSLIELGVAILVGIIIAAFAIEFAFAQMFKFRKRSAYPGVVLAELGASQRVDAAARPALRVIQRLLGTRAAFLALRSGGDDFDLMSASGMGGEAVERLLQAGVREVREAMRSQQPVPFKLPGGWSAESDVTRKDRLVFIPVVALRQPIGVLGVLGDKGNRDLNDDQLLNDIGGALGLSLQNLLQKEGLSKREKYYRSLIENSSDMITIVGMDGIIRYASPTAERAFGYSREELFSMMPQQFVHPDDLPVVMTALGRVVEAPDDRPSSRVEFRARHKDGSWRVLEAVAQNCLDDPAVAGIVINSRDITERKRAEEALHESQERLHTVIAGTPIITFALDPEGVFTLAEGKGLEALGLKPGQVIGESIFDMYSDVPQVGENIRRVLAGETFTAVVEVRGLVFEAWHSPLRDHNGEIAGVTGVVTNVTERKRAEEALRESEKKFRTLAETIAAAAFIIQGTRLRYVNSAAESISGYTREELLAMDFWDVIHPDLREEVKARGLARQRGEPAPTRYEAKLLTKEGNERWLDLTVGVTEFEGNPAVMGTGFDVTERRRAEEALRQSEELYRLLADNVTDMIWTRDLSLRPTYTSPSVTRLRGHTVEEAMAQTLEEVLTPDSLQVARRTLAEELAKESAEEKDLTRTRTLELEMYRKDGSTIWTEMTVTFLRDEENRPTGLMGVTRDISERRRAEEALQESEAKFRTLAETVAAGTFIYQGTRVRYVNSAAEALTGYTREEMLEMNFWDVIAPDFRDLARERGLARQKGEDVPLRYEVKLVTKDGHESWVDFTAGKVEFDGEPAVLGTAFDITERKRAEETIKHLAFHDALTDLPNRALLKDHLAMALAQARRKKRMLATLFLDLDHFKIVNDTVGHAEGDKLLRRVAERLTTLVREGDTVARVGGDEFTLLLSEVSGGEDAGEVAERVLECLRQPWVVQGQEFHVTTSIGIALHPGDGDDADTLLRNADTAMYRAKEHGRDNYQLYTPAMNARIAERLAVENSLRRGLERGEFVIHYQPQVDLRSGQVVGTEALARWQHPERGLVLPAEFIPIAEETGLIVPLGESVLRTACMQNKAWQDDGLPHLRMAVNLSARQFQQRNLIDMVAQVLEDTGLAAHCLQLEITEGVAMQDVDFTVAVLRSLRAMGVQIAMDDFGTGYSSLSYLKLLPVNAVKIDRSFVRDLTIDPNDAAIAAAVIAMAHNLGLSVIAEGVETEEQLALLKQWQCDEMQGYLFSKPVPAGKFRKVAAPDKRRSRARVRIHSS